MADSGPHQPAASPTPRPARAERADGGRRPGRPPRACPTSTSPWARPPRTCAEYENVSRAEHGRVRRPLASSWPSPTSENGFFETGDHPGHPPRRHGRQPRTTAPAPAPPSRSWPSSSPSSAPTAGHRRQRLPAERRRRRRGRHERHQGQASSASPRWPASSPSGVTGLNPEIMGLGPIEAMPPGAGPGRHDHRRHRPGRDQRGVRRPGASPRPSTSASRWDKLNVQRRRHRPRPPVRHDRRPHHDHADQRPPGRRTRPSASRRCASAAARAWR